MLNLIHQRKAVLRAEIERRVNPQTLHVRGVLRLGSVLPNRENARLRYDRRFHDLRPHLKKSAAFFTMRHLPSFPALRAFEAAARMGSFTDAGLELHLTPSAISHQIRALEEWFGKPMFNRVGRKVTVTDDGQRLLAEISQAFDLMEDACAVLRPNENRKRLNVHSAPSFAAKWLGPRLRDFMETHPSITIQLTSSAEPVAMNDSDVDVDIAYGTPLHDSGVIVEPLGMEATVPLCSPELIRGLSNPMPVDLARFTLIESKLNPVRWGDWWRLNGLKAPTRDRPSFDRGSLAIAAAVDGVGIALESTRFAERELACKDLIVLDGPGYRRVHRQFHFLCYKKSNRHDAKIQAFRTWLYSRLDTSLGLSPTPNGTQR